MTIHEMKQRKQELGYTNEQLSALSGVPLGTVMKVLSGATKAPRRSTLLALEKVLAPAVSRSVDPSSSLLRETGVSTSAPMVLQEERFIYATSPRSGQDTSDFLWRHDQEHKYTVDDYYALPDDIRTELIDGVFYDMASPSVLHQLVIGEMYIQFKECERKHKGACHVLLSPCDVQLDKDSYTMLQPDLLIVCDTEKIKGRNCYGAPDLTVEVLSPSSIRHDSILKLKKYKNAGVREYWIVDPNHRQIIVYLSREKEGSTFSLYTFDDIVPIGISEGECSIDFGEITENLRFLET